MDTKTQAENPLDPALQGQICEALDASVRSYDADTRHALRLARERAAREASDGRLAPIRNWLIGAMVAAPACLVVGLMVFNGATSEPLDSPPVEVLAIAEDAELYADLEFYEWMAQEQL